MTSSTHIPQSPLANYIKFMWHSEGYQPGYVKERVLPTGSSQLIINLEDTRFRHFEGVQQDKTQEYDRAIIAGIHSHPVFLDSRTRASTMGVVLKPGALQALFGYPADEFRDQVISFANVTTADIPALRQQLDEATTSKLKFSLLESFLNNHLDREFQPNPAVLFSARQLAHPNGLHSVSEISDKTGYSRRRLTELFRNAAGFTPKEFARVQRFQRALKKIRKPHFPDLPDIALSSGYYDQAHFNRDFKALSGLTPTQYLQNQTDEINHLPA
ncbi:helix-turn-helix domain-containing protein [Aliifodinibius sp. S!AR15-10]|uniref:AraC family transcriptional regulator n=1 Tax=Aliifodinibius sp. S!AR15-10 TaxID=2950437 RepID=UPI00285A2B0E|nr:helix-turn-helix domain-containing protein [Aliifodinibius sp. S!AR15-10]MDR8393904.1 helix-turn-helix domain-containing protein [Aliifodinibius sp. S!AR15-10]